jgi:hypothetical protein
MMNTGRGFKTFYLYTSFTLPLTIYRYEIASGRSVVWR